jgi:hypothetical protein
MKRPSPSQLANLGVGVLILIVIRSLSEVFRLEYLRGTTLTIGEIRPFILGALGAAVALAAALLANWAGWPRLSAAIAACAVILLFIYKVSAVG